ncbi:hypothetical protein B6N60_01667 [Richelia sinica FACHB-800]|uniref:Biotin carboxylase n=2 Tax=Richelia TaxID=98443 RepID=A0A975Y4A5_9NOST|nr:hypothetical protein B6N60_01667 [Richelia sinica FACHB-800]
MERNNSRLLPIFLAVGVEAYLKIKTQLSKLLKLSYLAAVMFLILGVFVPSALALTQIKLSDLTYKDCPPELAQGAVTSNGSGAANCFIVTGKAENGTYKTVYDADIYGRIYDANNDPILQNRTRLGSIPEVPPGVSDFELRISVPVNQPTPLKLKQFKASGFTAPVRK